MAEKKIYIAIDLKSFYASVECLERGLDPMTTNLVVADASRTEKTICLAVSPALKAWGVPGRPRLFEVVSQVAKVNAVRKQQALGQTLTDRSSDANALKQSPELAVDYIVAPPQMAHYMAQSTRIYNVYLKYVSKDDIFPYSIDEVFIDATHYLRAHHLTPRQFAMMMIKDVYQTTGITATAGIGTNMYLCKIAMDIVAKHVPADADGVRIAELNTLRYRQLLWSHRPLTDFWRIGPGYAKKLEDHGLYTMGDIARCSIGKSNSRYNEALLYKLFGKNAELLIDHAWGWEPCTMSAVKQHKPTAKSMGMGQVLQAPYSCEKTRLVVQEMVDQLALDLVEKQFVTSQVVLTIGYDIDNIKRGYDGPVTVDRYGRSIPKHAHGTANLECATASTALIMEGVMTLFNRIINPELLVRRINLAATKVVPEGQVEPAPTCEQLDLFTDYAAREKEQEEMAKRLEREKSLQKTMLAIKQRYGKSAVLKGMNLVDGATALDRNKKIGGHKA